MANGGDFDEDDQEYTFESHRRSDGKPVEVMKNRAGIVVSEKLLSGGRVVEALSFDEKDGKLSTRTLYEWDQGRKPLRTTTYDAEGDVVMSQERDKPPVTGEFYRGEKPFHVYPKKKNSFRSEVRPNGSADDGK